MHNEGGDEAAAKPSSSGSIGFLGENVGIGLEGWKSQGDGYGDLVAFSSSGAATSSAMNFTQRFWVGEAGEMIDVEQTLQFNRKFSVPSPALQSQTGLLDNPFNLGGSELNYPLGIKNNLLSPEPTSDLYALPYTPHGNVCIPSSAIPNLRSKTDDSLNPYNFGNSFRHNISCPWVTGSFCHDSVFQTRSSTAAAFYQPPLFPVRGMQSYQNYKMAETRKYEMIKNQEISIVSDSSDFRIGSSPGATFPAHKQKLVSQRHMCCSNASDGSKNFGTLPMHIWGHHAREVATMLEQPLSSSSLHHAGHLNLEDLSTSRNDKVGEERGWTMILQKELRNSDVGNLGRIVLPKKDAEANLPPLSDRNGIILLMEDMISQVIWEFKFRYWPNNQSRMYIMENTGGFVRSHKLQTGDFFIIYKEGDYGRYIVRGKRVHGSSFSADHEEGNCTLQGNMEGGVGTQQPRSNREIGTNHLPSMEQSTSLPTDILLLPEASVNATTSMGPSYNVERDAGGSTRFTPSVSDFDSFCNSL